MISTNKEGKSYRFAFYRNELLIERGNHNQSDAQERQASYGVPCQVEPPTPLPTGGMVHDCGEINGLPCKAYALSQPYNHPEPLPKSVEGCKCTPNEVEGESFQPMPEWKMMDLRASYDYLPYEHYYKGGKAAELLHWEKNSRFCPACGVETERISPIGKKCNCCHQEFYPQVSPAMIIRIRKGDAILLVRAKNFRGTFRGLVAGFVETGESLEECVHREVLEETGLLIENVKYFGSQPWPYPSVLMIGFTADYKSGELRLQEEELTAGDFFTKENLPELPRKLSLARHLIDAWIAEE